MLTNGHHLLLVVSTNSNWIMLLFTLYDLAFVIMFLVTVVIISTYPILACLEAPIPLVGYIMGAIYCDI